MYRLGLVPCLPWDAGWHLEPLVCQLTWAHLQEQTSVLSSPCQPLQWLPVLMIYLPSKTEPLYSLPGLRLSQRPREQFPPCDHGSRGNGNSNHLSGYLPQWLVPQNKAFQCGAPVVIPPLMLVVTDLCGWWTSAFRAGSLVICHWLLQVYFILNMSRYWGPWSIALASLESGLCQRLRNTIDSCSTHASMATSFGRLPYHWKELPTDSGMNLKSVKMDALLNNQSLNNYCRSCYLIRWFLKR